MRSSYPSDCWGTVEKSSGQRNNFGTSVITVFLYPDFCQRYTMFIFLKSCLAQSSVNVFAVVSRAVMKSIDKTAFEDAID